MTEKVKVTVGALVTVEALATVMTGLETVAAKVTVGAWVTVEALVTVMTGLETVVAKVTVGALKQETADLPLRVHIRGLMLQFKHHHCVLVDTSSTMVPLRGVAAGGPILAPD